MIIELFMILRLSPLFLYSREILTVDLLLESLVYNKSF